jgi:NTP pyrophosphatase (non-canonical NTP hydrolase)
MQKGVLVDFVDYQYEAGKTAIYPSELKLMYPTLGLAGEAGEFTNKVKKIYRDDHGVITNEKREALKGELGGILWYVQQCATDLDLSLQDIAEDNIAKLRSRAERGVLTGSGDDR